MMRLQVLADRRIREVEVSITRHCTLACLECGFLVPEQPSPAIGDAVDELAWSLQVLRDAGVRIGSLGVLGGEPTINGPLLERAVVALRRIGVAERIEVVSNGLTPRGLTMTAARAIDRFTISDYGLDERLVARWRTWLSLIAPSVELVVRGPGEGWDAWTSLRRVSREKAQTFYDTCWYRNHCVTLERRRLFSCSRIAKLSRDDEGLLLAKGTPFEAIEAYLHRVEAFASCESCTPMMDLPKVPVGVQPDDRLHGLQVQALKWLDAALAAQRQGKP